MGSGGNRFAEKLSYKLEILVLSDVKDCFASKSAIDVENSQYRPR
jgi:hypothetical protein